MKALQKLSKTGNQRQWKNKLILRRLTLQTAVKSFIMLLISFSLLWYNTIGSWEIGKIIPTIVSSMQKLLF